jgi:queuine tRNA-ribosyltransferase catalytic subunit
MCINTLLVHATMLYMHSAELCWSSSQATLACGRLPAGDLRPIDAQCQCCTCRDYSRAALHSALSLKLPAASTLVSLHNVAYMQNLTFKMRQAIQQGKFVSFVQTFMLQQYPDRGYPSWICNALKHVNIHLL